jgi:hypothetical protein
VPAGVEPVTQTTEPIQVPAAVDQPPTSTQDQK